MFQRELRNNREILKELLVALINQIYSMIVQSGVKHTGKLKLHPNQSMHIMLKLCWKNIHYLITGPKFLIKECKFFKNFILPTHLYLMSAFYSFP